MACGCSKNRNNGAARSSGGTYVYEFTSPGADEALTFLTMLEANRERRKVGGGTIVRTAVKQPKVSA